MGLVIVIISNLLLVHVNSSDTDFAAQSFTLLIKDKVMFFANVLTVLGLLVILYTPLSGFLKLAPLSLGQFFLAVGIAAIAVLWYELVKLYKYFSRKKEYKNLT